MGRWSGEVGEIEQAKAAGDSLVRYKRNVAEAANCPAKSGVPP